MQSIGLRHHPLAYVLSFLLVSLIGWPSCAVCLSGNNGALSYSSSGYANIEVIIPPRVSLMHASKHSSRQSAILLKHNICSASDSILLKAKFYSQGKETRDIRYHQSCENSDNYVSLLPLKNALQAIERDNRVLAAPQLVIEISPGL